ncbi:TetR/AcrR family transcriptional regulator [Microbacterium sp. YY-01]|uniref:TetR/AcrR family transcriptional regulator n=1 Tax=Microbacterium sp. YY-01 TaxID=3421634 RepID=UPI003D186762
MSADIRAGRPRVSSRETLAEAACELFLEQGYEATSVADIAQRVGVSRSSFFNYFDSKSHVLWAAFDERLDDAITRLRALPTPATVDDVSTVLRAAVAGFTPDALALAMRNAAAMGLEEELRYESAVRHARLAGVVAQVIRASGGESLIAEVSAAALAATVTAALWQWAAEGAGVTDLESLVTRALSAAAALTW